MPAPGPDAGLRAGREPVHRGEAPLREADRHLGPGAARPSNAASSARRCTRFAEEVAGEAQIDLRWPGRGGRGGHLPDRALRSPYFSGNTVQICPVGALTATPYRFTARPWDLDQVESTCTTCAVGCRVAVQSSQNRLTRLLGIDSEPVNHGWLCDKGRFTYESVNGDEVDLPPGRSAASWPTRRSTSAPATAAAGGQSRRQPRPAPGRGASRGRFEHGRLIEPRMRKSGELVPVSWGEALTAAARGHRRGQGVRRVRRGRRHRRRPPSPTSRLPCVGPSWPRGSSGPTRSTRSWATACRRRQLVLGLPRATIDEGGHGAAAGDPVRRPARGVAGAVPPAARGGRQGETTALIEIGTDPDRAQSAGQGRAGRLSPGDAPLVAKALTGDDAAVTAVGAHHENGSARPGRPGVRRGRSWPRTPPARASVVVAGRASYAESGEVTAEERCAPWRPRCPRPSSFPPSAGATCSARSSTWAWPRASWLRPRPASTLGAAASRPPGALVPAWAAGRLHGRDPDRHGR